MADIAPRLSAARPTRRFLPADMDWNIVWLSLPAFLIVLALFIYPFLFGIGTSLQGSESGGGPWTLTNYQQFLSDPYLRAAIGTTFAVALPVTLFGVAVSIPLAYFMRRGVKLERPITIILILPVTLGSVMVAQGMLSYFGPTGWFNHTLQALGLIHDPLPLLHNWLAVEIALFIQGFPFVFLLILGYMSAINPDLERASRMLGASAWQTFWRVVFPLSLPGIAIAFCLSFVANFGVFPTADLVGEPTHLTFVLSIAAYTQAFNNLNLPLGTAIAVVMGLLELIVIGLVLWLQSRIARGAAISGGKGA